MLSDFAVKPLVQSSWSEIYVISEMKEDTCGNCYVLQEYPVSIQDYCRINTGQTVTLEVSDSRLDVCKVVKIE